MTDTERIADLTERLRQMTAAFNAQEDVLITQQKLTKAVRELYFAACRKQQRDNLRNYLTSTRNHETLALDT